MKQPFFLLLDWQIFKKNNAQYWQELSYPTGGEYGILYGNLSVFSQILKCLYP